MAKGPGTNFLARIVIINEQVSACLEGPLKSAGLSFGMFELLAAVRAARGGASQASLAAGLGIAPPSLCEAVQIATKKGFVQQESSATDRRKKNVVLTPLGERSLKVALDAFAALESKISGGIAVNKIASAADVLDRISSKLESELNSAS